MSSTAISADQLPYVASNPIDSNGTDLSSRDLSPPDSSQRLPQVPFVTREAMVSTQLLEQFDLETLLVF